MVTEKPTFNECCIDGINIVPICQENSVKYTECTDHSKGFLSQDQLKPEVNKEKSHNSRELNKPSSKRKI
jgi:hypothetical protein